MLKYLELISCELLRVQIVSIINSFARSVCSLQVSILWLCCGCQMLPLSLSLSSPLLSPSLSSNSLMISALSRKSLLPGIQLLQIPQQAATSVELQPKLVLQVSLERKGEERERGRQQINVCLQFRFLVRTQQQVRLPFLLSQESQSNRIKSAISAWLLCLPSRSSTHTPPPSIILLISPYPPSLCMFQSYKRTETMRNSRN